MTIEKTRIPGVGADIGTMNLLSARRVGKGIQIRRERNVFVSLPAKEARETLRVRKKNFVERGDEVFIVGDSALTIAQMMGRECRRPLRDGLIHAGEMDAIDVLGVLVKTILGDPVVPDESCYFSIPAPPVDEDRDVVYHSGVFERIIQECGYRAAPSNEGMAIIFAETADDDFSGIGISFGAGLCNVALASEAIAGMQFSISRAGDWIDNGASKAVGMTSSQICALKESGLDLMKVAQNDRPREALALYYKSMINYCLDHLSTEFQRRGRNITLPKPIPMVVSGGTSMAQGFLDLFREIFEERRSRFPIDVSEIRQAREPLNAVAQGLMTQAVLEHT